MKFSRMLAVGAAAALVGVSTLAIGGSASAADLYVDDSEFGVEGASYPAGWFIGAGSTGTVTSGVNGLTITGNTQILNGTTPTTDLGALVDGADFGVVSGNANFQIPLFTDGVADTGFTTLRPDNFGPVGLNPLAGWTTSGAVGSFAAGTSHTIPEYVAELAALGDDYEILAFGLIAPAGAVVSHVTWAGDTHWFLPAPTAAVTPASLTIAAMGTTGVSGVFTGFIPGESVSGTFSNGGSGGAIPGSFTADANGSVTVAYSEASLVAGTYYLGARGLSSGVMTSGSFAVTANPATLAATGTDFTPAIAAGGVMLLLGAGLVLAGRRRAAAHRR
ncbi:LPXTG cell wall anchor domain-containing protein [Homoserinimonas sp. A447]